MIDRYNPTSSCPTVAGSIRLVVEDNMPSRSDRPMADLNAGLVVEDNMPSRSDRPMADLNAGLSFPPVSEGITPLGYSSGYERRSIINLLDLL